MKAKGEALRAVESHRWLDGGDRTWWSGSGSGWPITAKARADSELHGDGAALLLCHCGSMVALSRSPGISATALMEEERGLGLVASRKGRPMHVAIIRSMGR